MTGIGQPLEGATFTHNGYTVLVHDTEEDETGYWAQVVELPGCYAQGETLEDLKENAQEGIEGYLEVFGQPPAGEAAADWP